MNKTNKMLAAACVTAVGLSAAQADVKFGAGAVVNLGMKTAGEVTMKRTMTGEGATAKDAKPAKGKKGFAGGGGVTLCMDYMMGDMMAAIASLDVGYGYMKDTSEASKEYTKGRSSDSSSKAEGKTEFSNTGNIFVTLGLGASYMINEQLSIAGKGLAGMNFIKIKSSGEYKEGAESKPSFTAVDKSCTNIHVGAGVEGSWKMNEMIKIGLGVNYLYNFGSKIEDIDYSDEGKKVTATAKITDVKYCPGHTIQANLRAVYSF